MTDLIINKKPFRLYNVIGIIFSTVFFLIGGNLNPIGIVRGGEPTYTITLDSSNAPSSLNSSTFSNGSNTFKYVNFDYNSAKNTSGKHAVLSSDGSISNNASTRITSIKSIMATFTGGDATLRTGRSTSTLTVSERMTSELEITFTVNPYFFSISNAGSTELSLTSLVITYSCSPSNPTITYNSHGGTSILPTTHEVGSAVSAPVEPTRSGFTFAGWYLDNAFKTSYTFPVMPEENITLYAKWSPVTPYEIVTISAFKLTAPETYSVVEGVVLWAISDFDMSLVVIADATSTLGVLSNANVVLGDHVQMGGYPSLMNGTEVKVMSNEFSEDSILNYFNSNEAIPLTPTPTTVEGFIGLNIDEPANWLAYLSISGTLSLEVDPGTGQPISFYLTSGAFETPLVVMGYEAYLSLVDYIGYEVTVSGLSLPNMDNPSAPFLMFIYLGGNTISLNYTDAEIATLVANYIATSLSTPSYYPGQVIVLPSSVPVTTATITYETTGPNAGKLNVSTGAISSDISSSITIDMIVHVTKGTATSDKSFSITVNPLVFTSISTFLAQPDSETTYYYLKGIVIYLQLANDLVMIADSTGIVYVNTSDDSWLVGDEIVAYGIKRSQVSPGGKMVFLVNNPAITIILHLSSSNGMPLTPIIKTIVEFLALDHHDVSNHFAYIKLSGGLREQDGNMYLTDGTNNVGIFAPTGTAEHDTLTAYVGQDVYVCGLAIIGGSEADPNIYFVFIGFPGDVGSLST